MPTEIPTFEGERIHRSDLQKLAVAVREMSEKLKPMHTIENVLGDYAIRVSAPTEAEALALFRKAFQEVPPPLVLETVTTENISLYQRKPLI